MWAARYTKSANEWVHVQDKVYNNNDVIAKYYYYVGNYEHQKLVARIAISGYDHFTMNRIPVHV